MRPIVAAVAGLAAIVFAGMAPARSAPADAIRSGDMARMIDEIVAIYEGAGVSWDGGIEWRVGPFTTTYWFYDPNTDEIEAGAVPTPAQVESYWQTWSRVLTDGNFDPSGFFASEAEARELARYNQFVLATHESAHAVTYRYDYDHLERHNWSINCREYYADRLTVAILNDEAQRDPDMARWRARYSDLVIAMGETIPAQYRYHIPDFAALDADCDLIDVAQPTPDAMQPYASAYFERYRVLLEAELPPLAAVFDTYLTGVLAARNADLAVAAEREGLSLTTLGARDQVELGTVYGDPRGDSGTVSRAAAFDPEGRLWFATLAHDRDRRLVEFAFGTDPEASPPAGPPAPWAYPSMRLEISSLAVLSADRFLISLEHWDREGEAGAERHFVTWVQADRRYGGWSFEGLGEIEGMSRGAVLRGPDNRIFLFASPDEPSGAPSDDWRGLEFSLDTGDATELAVPSAFYFPLAIDGESSLYEELGNMLWRSDRDGRDEVLIGNGLMGPRDGVGAIAEIADIQVLQWMDDGRALLIDRGPGYTGWITRELRPDGQAAPAAP